MDVLKEVKEVYEKHHKSIVLILNDDGVGTTLGTGFLIHQKLSRLLVMTCQHVIAQGQKICVRLAGSSSEYVAKILHEHEETDLAILEIDMDVEQPLLEFREDSSDVGVGQRVFLAAYYHPDMMASLTNVVCLNPTVMPGKICSSLSEFEGNPQFTEIAHSCRSQGGCSGGPLIYDSNVIGVHYQCQTQIC
ncbi:hypothetical protein SORBI_3003G431400 [Sorghum bicolor]|uniref:Peptidase S1 domain-containing protein n=1 Tax=Sorghum bicolor TaxID=4558 RepID=A0A1B6Q8B5_SORBI|nr:hypothetical protein SORBI_3003G431400 [Sorghum bicolor]OQU88216.1 hypothetical protein SORBI_3003G431400 [Sorghum bicolor]